MTIYNKSRVATCYKNCLKLESTTYTENKSNELVQKGLYLTQRFPFKKPTEFMALCAKSKKEMLSIRPAEKPWIKKLAQFHLCEYYFTISETKLVTKETWRRPRNFKFGARAKITNRAPVTGANIWLSY